MLKSKLPLYGAKAGTTGCPVGCKYCMVTKIESRRRKWEKFELLGINKSVTMFNPPSDLSNPEEVDTFYKFPLELLEGDIVGFNGISDCFWPKYRRELEYVLDNLTRHVKLLTLVTKFCPPNETLEKVSEHKDKCRLVVSITGLDVLENTSTKQRLDVLKRAKEMGIMAFPIIHPYIPGMSDLSFLPELLNLGYDQIDVKGLRYNPVMNEWMPPEVREYFAGSKEEEILIDDGVFEKIEQAGFTKMRLREWYVQDFKNLLPHLSLERATLLVDEVLKYAIVSSSDTDTAVREFAIKRRL